LKIVSDTAVGAALVLASSVALHGYVRRNRIPILLRGAFVLAALCMGWPQPVTQYAAVAAAGGLFLFLLRSTETSPAPSR
jgi:hypothetical protein